MQAQPNPRFKSNNIYMWLEFPSHEIDPSRRAVISSNGGSFSQQSFHISLQRQVLITSCLNYYLGIPLWDLVSSASSLPFLSDWSALNTGCLLWSISSLDVKIPHSLLEHRGIPSLLSGLCIFLSWHQSPPPVRSSSTYTVSLPRLPFCRLYSPVFI